MFDKGKIMRIDFDYGVGTLTEQRIALFHADRISEGAVRKFIKQMGPDMYHPLILFITKEQFENVFVS